MVVYSEFKTKYPITLGRCVNYFIMTKHLRIKILCRTVEKNILHISTSEGKINRNVTGESNNGFPKTQNIHAFSLEPFPPIEKISEIKFIFFEV